MTPDTQKEAKIIEKLSVIDNKIETLSKNLEPVLNIYQEPPLMENPNGQPHSVVMEKLEFLINKLNSLIACVDIN
jgi:hypothetical protein